MPTPGQHWTMPIAHGVWDNQINDWIVGWYSGMVHPIDLTWDCWIRKTLKPEFCDFPQKHVLQSVNLAASHVLAYTLLHNVTCVGLHTLLHNITCVSLHIVRQCHMCWLTHIVTQYHMCWLTHCYTMSHVLALTLLQNAHMCWLTHCYRMPTCVGLHTFTQCRMCWLYTHLHTVVNTNHLLRHSSAIWSTHRHDHRRSGFHRHTPISCCASYSSAQFHNHFNIKLANTRCSSMQDRKIAPQAPSDK